MNVPCQQTNGSKVRHQRRVHSIANSLPSMHKSGGAEKCSKDFLILSQDGVTACASAGSGNVIPEHRGKKVGWYKIGSVYMPTASNIHEAVRKVSEKTLERAHGHGLPCCRRRKHATDLYK